MPKSLTILLCAVLPVILLGTSQQYEVSANIGLGNVRPFVKQVNEQLGLKLNAKVLSDYSYSIAVGNKFSEPVDVHYRGTVLTITYKIEKNNSEYVNLCFLSFNRDLIADIRTQITAFATIAT